MRTNSKNPILRMYDDDGELLGIFSIITGEIVKDNDLADYDIRFVKKEIARNRQNWLETWNDYVEMFNNRI
ncbi:hypothetical protein [Streptococcus ovuberis]|uniref:hypothetical protein n=1 Tax=Streptococcus ovuberis TaxID=1936207 RepID=UPI001FEBFA16|nr:hypothetical protein [Streptococcus ovuberis]